MSALRYLLNVITGGSGEKISHQRIAGLISARLHSHLLVRRRALVILSRIRLMTIVGMVLFLAGILMDVASFPPETSSSLALFRGISALLLLGLMVVTRQKDTLRDAYVALGIFFAINLVFQGLYQPLILPQFVESIDGLTSASYAIFPFLVVVCIAIFPLTFKETFLTLILIFTSELLILSLMPSQVNPMPGLGILLSLMGASMLCAFSSISQLSYMLSLVEQASVDSLTNCYSRNSGEEILDVQFRIAQRQKADLAVVFLDIDNFKIINDQFGHEAGDRILAEAAASMKRNLRDSDVLIRWGGEEFVMLLPNTNAAGAGKAIRRMRTNGFGLRPDGQPVTASIGITDIRSVGTKSWTDLVDQADEEMYRVKTHGKNNVSVVRIANTSIAS